MFDFLFDWAPEFDTNVESLDNHHKQLFRIGRDIEQLLQRKCIGVTDQQLLDIVMGLKEYVSYHFYEEETLMMDYAYPDVDEHKEYHKLFAKRVATMNIPALKEDPVTELKKIRDLLIDMVFTHILIHDMNMTKYVLAVQKKMQDDVVALNPTIDENELKYGPKIGELDMSKVYLYKNQELPGRCVILHREKAKDISKLSALERNFFFADLALVAKAIQKLYNPQAFDYASFGDVEEHLHFHIIPKYSSDASWGKPFSMDLTLCNLTEEEYANEVFRLRKELKLT